MVQQPPTHPLKVKKVRAAEYLLHSSTVLQKDLQFHSSSKGFNLLGYEVW